MKRYKGWSDAVKHIGLVYMLAEWLFYTLGTLSPLVIRSRIIRMSKGVAVIAGFVGMCRPVGFGLTFVR